MPDIYELGVGIVYHSGIDNLIERTADLIDVFELEPQTIWFRESSENSKIKYDISVVERLQTISKPLIFHGVGFPVGGTKPPDKIQIPILQELMDKMKPRWMSEHLSFNTAYNSEGKIFNTNLLLPPRQTTEGAACSIKSVLAMKEDIGIPFAFETGVNYLQPLADELSDGEFIARIAEGTDSYILLDLHNIYANELNGRQSVKQFLNQIPLERVIEIHIAGGFYHDGYYLDAHSGISSDILLEMTEKTVSICPNLKAIIFEMLPEYSSRISINELRDQFKSMREIWRKHRSEAKTKDKTYPLESGTYTKLNYSPYDWEYALGNLVVGQDPGTELGEKLKNDKGIQIFRELLFHFRASIIVSTLKLSSRLLRLSLGEKEFVSLINKFMEEYFPENFPFVVAVQFANFLRKQNLSVKYLDDILEYEETTIKVSSDNTPRTIYFDYNPLPLLRALSNSKLPEESLEAIKMEIEIKPDEQVENPNDLFKLNSVYHS